MLIKIINNNIKININKNIMHISEEIPYAYYDISNNLNS